MTFLVLTGGVASGKSTVGELLKSRIPASHWFDADAEVSSLLDSGSLADPIRAAFGPDSVSPSGKANRDVLRQAIFTSPDKRKLLEAIIHPEIRRLCAGRFDAAKRSPDACLHPLFVADIPLYFESGAQWQADAVMLVAVSPQTQLNRLVNRDGRPPALARAIIDAQLPLEKKIPHSNFVLWNEGPVNILNRQLSLALASLLHPSRS